MKIKENDIVTFKSRLTQPIMEIQFLSHGDVFKHPLFNFNLKVSDTDEGIVQTEDMNPKTGDHIFFIGEQLKEEVTLVATKP